MAKVASLTVAAALAVVGSLAAVGVIPIATSGGGGGGNTANVWVNPGNAGGSPSRCSTACTYVAANAYGDLGSAYVAASPGDTIRVRSGTFGAVQEIDYSSSKNTAATQIQILTDTGVVTFGSGLQYGDCNTLDAPTYLTLDGGTNKWFHVGDSSHPDSGFTACNGQQDTITNVEFGHVMKTTGAIFEWREMYTTTISNSVFGPACCGYNGTSGSTPWNMLLAVCDSPPNCSQGPNPFSGSANNVDSTVTGNTFYGDSRFCDAWDLAWGSSFGTCSANGFSSCPDSTQCHGDCIHEWGATNLTITDNLFLHCDTQGIFLEETNGGTQISGSIENNYFNTLQDETGDGFGVGNHGIWGGFCSDTCYGAASGTFTVEFNTAAPGSDIGVDFGCTGTGPPTARVCKYGTTTFDVIGNDGFAVQGNDANACSGGTNSDGVLDTHTYVYKYNVWSSDSGWHINNGVPDTCDVTDAAATNATMKAWYNDLIPPTLATVANPPVGFVGTGATYCVGSDYNGNSRAGSTCNAGLLNQ